GRTPALVHNLARSTHGAVTPGRPAPVAGARVLGGPLVSEPTEFFTGTRDLPGDAPRPDQPESRSGTAAVIAPALVTPESGGGPGDGAGAGPPGRAPGRALTS